MKKINKKEWNRIAKRHGLAIEEYNSKKGEIILVAKHGKKLLASLMFRYSKRRGGYYFMIASYPTAKEIHDEDFYYKKHILDYIENNFPKYLVKRNKKECDEEWKTY